MVDSEGTTAAEVPQRRIGPYLIQRLLGQGGMGRVYLGWDTRLDRPVAIKAIASSLADDETVRVRFMREAKLACAVTHPYVASVFDVISEGEELFLVMEYVDGWRLDRLPEGVAEQLEERLRLGIEVGEALHSIHENGLIHRDIKPNNVMVTKTGHVKLVDFGIARQVHQARVEGGPEVTETEGLTAEGAHVGTLAYSSPEQLRGEPLDRRSDLFSYGVLLHELLTGVHPFRRATEAATISAILSEDPSGTETLTAAMGTATAQSLFEKLLAKSSDGRYASAVEVTSELERILEGKITQALRRRRVRIAASLAAVLAVIGTSGAFIAHWLTRPLDRDQPRVAVAMVPLVDKIGDEGGVARGAMIADLAAVDLEVSALVRALGPEYVLPALEGMDAASSPREIARRLHAAFAVDYVMVGSLYREGSHYLATFQAIPASHRPELPPIRVEGDRLAELAEEFATRFRKALPGVSMVAAWRDDRTEVESITSSSEPARLVYERGRLALRGEHLLEAIEYFEEAARLDPSFVMAHVKQAGVLYSMGYVHRAQEAANQARTVVLDVEDSLAARRLGLTVRMMWGTVFGNSGIRLEAARQLAELFPDEPRVVAAYAAALAAIEEIDRAVEVIDTALAMDPRDAALRLEKGIILIGAYRYQDALGPLEQAEKMYRLLESPAGVAQVQLRRSRALRGLRRFDEALAQADAAAAVFDELGWKVMAANSELAAARVNLKRGAVGAAHADFDRATELAREVGNEVLLATVFGTRGAQEVLEGKLVEAEKDLKQSIALAEKLGEESSFIEPMFNLASLYSYTGRAEPARKYVDRVVAMARRLDVLDSWRGAILLAADLDYQSGDVTSALEHYRELTREGAGPGLEPAWAHLGVAEITQRQDRLGTALAAAEKGFDAFGAANMPVYQAYARVRRAELLGAVDRGEEARAELVEAERVSAGVPQLEDLRARTILARGEIEALAGRWKQALSRADRVSASVGAATPSLGVPAHVLAARCLVHLGRTKDAMARARLAEEVERAPVAERVRARVALAEALERAGLSGQAAGKAREALDGAEGMGMLLSQARAAAVLLRVARDLDRETTGRLQALGNRALDDFLAEIPEGGQPAPSLQQEIEGLRRIFRR